MRDDAHVEKVARRLCKASNIDPDRQVVDLREMTPARSDCYFLPNGLPAGPFRAWRLFIQDAENAIAATQD